MAKTFFDCALRRLGAASLVRISLSTLGYLCLASDITLAQVTSDGTVDTQVNQNGNVSEITGGETRGDNLFHSFEDFSVKTGDTASFLNANDIANIFSRVTGGNISNIDGLIKANGSANLFLINPAGIIFGENASLDIGGSFYGSSADSILFEDGEFSATDLNNPPVLTINAPIGLGFRDQPGDIVNRSNFSLTDTVVDGTEFTILDSVGLKINPNQTIALIGGNVILKNAAGITAPGGKVELGGLTQAGEITINEDGSLSFPEGIDRGDVTLTGQSRVKVAADGGGSIKINARNLKLNQQSELYAGIAEDVGSPDAQAGNITVDATDSVRLVGSGRTQNVPLTLEDNDYDTAIRSLVGLKPNNVEEPNLGRNPKSNSTAIGNTGSIIINTDLLQISDRAAIVAKIYGKGNTGNITVSANDIQLNGGDVLNQVRKGAIGNAGDINLQARSLSSENLAFIISDTKGKGDAGNITIDAPEKVILDGTNGATQINLQVGKGAEGNGGNLEINTKDFSLLNRSSILADTSGKGNAGNVNINANKILIDGLENTSSKTKILTQAKASGIGNSGDIQINTEELTVDNRSIIAADSSTLGDAGNISINASENVFFGVDTSILSQIQPDAEGRGGDIKIDTKNLHLFDSFVLSDSKGVGDAGSITINASESILLEDAPDTNTSVNKQGSLIISGVGILGDETEGDAGNIEINTKSFTSNGSSFIVAQTNGVGDGGNITINSQESLFLNDSSRVISQVGKNAVGNGGEINITSPIINLNGLSAISTTTLAGGEGVAGNIKLDTNNLTLTDTSIIDAVTENEFDGGDVTIAASNIELLGGSKIITATDSAGNAGNITLDIDEKINISGNNPEFSQFITELAQDEIIRENEKPANDRFKYATPSSILKVLGGSSGLFANTSEKSTGNGGNIQIGNPQEFSLAETALISVGSQGNGSAGSLAIDSQSLSLNNGSLFAATPSGVGGNITLSIADNLVLDNQSLVSSQARENAKGGDINIDSKFIIAYPDGDNDILANAQEGQGGNITINADSLFGIEERPLNDLSNDINASSRFNLDGNVNVNTLDLNPLQGATELPINVVEPEQTKKDQACQADQEGEIQNGLVVKGKGGVPASPDQPLTSQNIIVDGKISSASNIPAPIETSQGKIQPARGLIVTKDGRVILTAYRTNNAGERIPEEQVNCGRR